MTTRLSFHGLLHYERELRGWSQADLAEKVGCETKTISRWESGDSIPRPNYRQLLCEIFQKNAEELGLMKDWSEDLDTVNLDGREDENAPPAAQSHTGLPGQRVSASSTKQAYQDPAREHPIVLPPHIPDEPYFPLPRREEQLHQLLTALRDPLGSTAIVIDGLGGTGKTAFALELARRALQHELFEKAVGDSAKQGQFTSEGIVRINEATLDFQTFLDTIARQLDHWEVTRLRPEEKLVRMAQLLRQHRYLLIIDNLESVDNAQKLVADLRGFLGGSKALITSRQKVRHDFVLPHSLSGLDQEDALLFIRRDLRQRGGDQLRQASREKLLEICQVTGGVPLALKLVVAQAMFLDVDIVLQQLKHASNDIYAFIFYESWERLSTTAQQILTYIGRTVTTTASWEELAGIGIAEQERELREAVHQLVDASLLDVYTLSGQVRYGIHRLTQQFVKSDSPRQWEAQRQTTQEFQQRNVGWA